MSFIFFRHWFSFFASLVFLMSFFAICDNTFADEIEFLNGSRLQGTITEIRKDDKEFDAEVKIGTRTIKRTYPFAQVHAVTYRGKRFELNPMTADAKKETRSKREIDQLINGIGATPPDWFDAKPLEFPKTLDLSWPKKTKGGWNNQVNVGQYLWDVINPNPSKWQSGIRLLHHVMTLHANDRELLDRDMRALGRMYFHHFQDYPRAAFWLRKAGATPGTRDAVMLAECYWRMGNRSMALKQLESRTLNMMAIKLLGDLGETERAIRLAKAYVHASNGKGNSVAQAKTLAADAYRSAGEYDKAIEVYQEVIAQQSFSNPDYAKRFRERAQASIDAIELFEKIKLENIADGTYTAQTVGYNGAVEVRVSAKDGVIESVEVIRHNEKQFYAAISDTTSQLKSKQSVTGIDATSGATITSQAIVNATAKALAKGAQ